MKKDVLISISSTQNFEGAEPDEINLVTQGRLYKRDGKFFVSYEESELTGLAGTRTTLKLEKDRVSMIRTGKKPSQMLFAEHERHVGLYQTVLGALTISTHTSSIVNTIGEDGGELAIDYTIEVDHTVAGVNRFAMNVKIS